MKFITMHIDLINIARLLQFTDSACPIGSFAFSCGLESAVAHNIVHDASTLKEYAYATAMQAAFCDCIVAIHAHRATLKNDYKNITDADHSLIMAKMNDEARTMLTRMGRKFVELGNSLLPHGSILDNFLADIKNGITPGTFPVAQGAVFALMNIPENELFAAHQYGVINMVLNAALRCVKVSHLDTQKILFELMKETTTLFNEIKDYNLNEIHSFCPELDLMASIHEKGQHRMFMN